MIDLRDFAFWATIVSIVDVCLAMGVTVHAVLCKRDTRSVIAWVGFVWLVPLLGVLGYVCFGINRIERKGLSLGLADSWRPAETPLLGLDDASQLKEFEADYGYLIGIARAGRQLTGSPLVPGNSVQPLVNGDEAFPRMIEAIDQARESVSLQTYIFDCDAAGRRFVAALASASRRGVAVRVLIDDVGAKYSRPSIVRSLRQAGIHVALFLPTWVPRLPRYANLRNHRKILVVDGRVAFTGGTNIRSGHLLKEQPTYPVQCLHFELTGQVVSQIQRAFASDWAFASGESISGPAWFPHLKPTGNVWARGLESGPDENFEVLIDLIMAALASARQRVRIVTPYFLPTTALIKALNVADMRGVDVEILLPEKNNVLLIQWAATAQMWQLLEKGCRIFCSKQPFDHTKLMIVDDCWVLLGSTNWDPRSLRLNFEFNVECYDRALAVKLGNIIDAKLASSSEILLEDVHARSFPIKLRDGLARLLSPML